MDSIREDDEEFYTQDEEDTEDTEDPPIEDHVDADDREETSIRIINHNNYLHMNPTFNIWRLDPTTNKIKLETHVNRSELPAHLVNAYVKRFQQLCRVLSTNTNYILFFLAHIRTQPITPVFDFIPENCTSVSGAFANNPDFLQRLTNRLDVKKYIPLAFDLNKLLLVSAVNSSKPILSIRNELREKIEQFEYKQVHNHPIETVEEIPIYMVLSVNIHVAIVILCGGRYYTFGVGSNDMSTFFLASPDDTADFKIMQRAIVDIGVFTSERMASLNEFLLKARTVYVKLKSKADGNQVVGSDFVMGSFQGLTYNLIPLGLARIAENCASFAVTVIGPERLQCGHMGRPHAIQNPVNCRGQSSRYIIALFLNTYLNNDHSTLLAYLTNESTRAYALMNSQIVKKSPKLTTFVYENRTIPILSKTNTTSSYSILGEVGYQLFSKSSSLSSSSLSSSSFSKRGGKGRRSKAKRKHRTIRKGSGMQRKMQQTKHRQRMRRRQV